MDDVLPGLSIESLDGRIVVSGEVDAHTADTLEKYLADMPAGDPIRLDLAAVSFMDSSGLRVLIDTHQRTTGTESALVIVAPSHSVTRLLDISGLTEHLTIESA